MLYHCNEIVIHNCNIMMLGDFIPNFSSKTCGNCIILHKFLFQYNFNQMNNVQHFEQEDIWI